MQFIAKLTIDGKTYKVLVRQLKTVRFVKRVEGEPPSDAPDLIDEAIFIAASELRLGYFLVGTSIAC